MDLTDRLSKSRYTKGLRCPLALYLSVHQYDLGTKPSLAAQARFDVGNRVGEIARERFPGGVLIDDDHFHHREAVEHTSQAIDAGVPAVFEAAFCHDNVKVRADVLLSLPGGGYELIEVKSTKGYDRDKHLPDASVQLYVLLGSGVDVRRVSLMHLDGSYVYPGGDYDPAAVLTSTDITSEAFEYIKCVPENIAWMMDVLRSPEAPEKPAGINCSKPYECEFHEWCFRDEVGPDLTEEVRTVPAILRRLDELPFPLVFVDFETLNPALPVFVGTSPYQITRVQWSIHILHEDGRLLHDEWLVNRADVNPDDQFMGGLLASLPATGTFVHYSAYEQTQLIDMSCRIPKYRQALVDCIPGFYSKLTKKMAGLGISYAELHHSDVDGLVDFDLGLRVVKDGCLHPVFGPSGKGWSIKDAIKVLAPELPPYASLAVCDGTQAMIDTQVMLDPKTNPDEAARIRSNLLTYCEQDTMSMVLIYRNLKALGSN